MLIFQGVVVFSYLKVTPLYLNIYTRRVTVSICPGKTGVHPLDADFVPFVFL